MSDLAPTNTRDNPLLRYALAYAERGIAVFATTADGKAPSISNKTWGKYLGRVLKKGEGGLHQASTDPENLKWQFSQPGSGGIGAPCGRVNNMIVADFDVHKEEGKVGNANDKVRLYWDEIEATQTVTTRNGGLHAYFAYRRGHGKHELGENIEVQTDGAYVLLPPSKGYTWGPQVLREDWPEPPWEGIPTRAMTRDRAESLSSEDLQAMLRDLADGNWHNTMRDVCASLVMQGWDDYEILALAPRVTLKGYHVFDTLQSLNEYIGSAKVKWITSGRPPTREERMKRWMDDFRIFDEGDQKGAVQWLKEQGHV